MPALVLAASLSAAPAARAQEIRGTVFDADSRLAIGGADIRAFVAGKRKLVIGVVSDSLGRFALLLPASGKYTLLIRQPGYTESTTNVVQVAADEVVHIELSLGVQPLALEPIRVVARNTQPNPYLASQGFYDRRLGGTGYFVTRSDVEKRAATLITDVLRYVPGVRLVRADRSGRRRDVSLSRAGARCAPAILLDGIPARPGGARRPTDVAIDDMVVVTEIEGIEVYSGPSQAPPNFSRNSECGVIVIWTKRRH